VIAIVGVYFSSPPLQHYHTGRGQYHRQGGNTRILRTQATANALQRGEGLQLPSGEDPSTEPGEPATWKRARHREGRDRESLLLPSDRESLLLPSLSPRDMGGQCRGLKLSSPLGAPVCTRGLVLLGKSFCLTRCVLVLLTHSHGNEIL